MARQTVIEYVDDLDGAPIEPGDGGTVEFAFGGVNYEIDLTKANEAAFAGLVLPYITAGRKVAQAARGGRGVRVSRPVRSDKEHLRAVREWAAVNGLPVKLRGRIKQEIVDQYDAAMAA
jgi:hypothetical protein